jgi:glucokinase
MFSSDAGRSHFQAKPISWSMRARGIVPRILPFIKASPFRQRFERKGRFKDYMADIPTQVITHQHAALLGAARVAFAASS